MEIDEIRFDNPPPIEIIKLCCRRMEALVNIMGIGRESHIQIEHIII